MPVAAELSVLLVTSAAAAAAFPQEVQTIGLEGGQSISYLQFTAATILRVMASIMMYGGCSVMGPQYPTLPAAFASNSVQRAMVLHPAACMPYCMDQMQKEQRGGSSSGCGTKKMHVPPAPAVVAAAEATALAQLQRSGFQRLQDVSGYGSIACTSAGVYGIDDDPPRGHLAAAYGGLQLAFVLRRQAMGHPMWPQLYKGAITRPSAAVTANAVDGLLAPIVAPGTDPLMLQELLLHPMLVLGVSDTVGMAAGLGIGLNSLQPATPRSADKAQVGRCLQLLWLRLGREMQQAAGVELDDADVSTAAAGHVFTDGANFEKALTATDIMLDYGYALLDMFMWHSVFLTPAVAQFQEQPQLACRGVEAAARSCKWPSPHAPPPRDASQSARHFKGLRLAVVACNPAKADLVSTAYQKPKLVLRCCSLAVSAMKQVQQQLPAAKTTSGWHEHVLPELLTLANHAACMGCEFWSAAQASTANQDAAVMEGVNNSWGPGGVNTAWLALTAKGLMSVGSVLGCAEPWIMACSRAGSSSSMQAAALQQLSRHGEAVAWVAEQLTLLLAMQQEQQQDTSATSRLTLVVDPAVLVKLQQQAVELSERLQPLQDACKSASQSSSSAWGLRFVLGSNRTQAAAAFLDFNFACGEGGWLPEALQVLGCAVWSAFPQKYACNDPACGNVAGFAKASCAKKVCSDCKVAHYCCQEHQARHWSQHKPACKAIKGLLAASQANVKVLDSCKSSIGRAFAWSAAGKSCTVTNGMERVGVLFELMQVHCGVAVAYASSLLAVNNISFLASAEYG